MKIALTVYFQVETAINWLLKHGKRVFDFFGAQRGWKNPKNGKSEETAFNLKP